MTYSQSIQKFLLIKTYKIKTIWQSYLKNNIIIRYGSMVQNDTWYFLKIKSKHRSQDDIFLKKIFFVLIY